MFLFLTGMSFERRIQKYSEHPLTSQILLAELKGYDRPFDKINDLVKKGLLIQLKRGLYLPGSELNMAPPEPFLIANHLYAPSYISVESALSYWGLIPEKVYEVTSCTTKQNKRFKTPCGNFTFINISVPYYSLGIERVALTKKQTVLLAIPEKALVDKIITTTGIILRSKKQVLEFLIEDLRIDEDNLKEFDLKMIIQWLPFCKKKKSIDLLIQTLKDL